LSDAPQPVPPPPLCGLAHALDGPEDGHSLREAETEALLERVGVAPGAACLDVGPGTPSVLRPIARRLGPRGRVTCLVPDSPQVDAARRRLAGAGLAGVHVGAWDSPLARPAAAFDLVHARYGLAAAGIEGAAGALRALVACVRPGGVVAVQEPDASFWRCYPPHPSWDRLTGAVCAALTGAGADVTAGQRAYRLFRLAGLEGVRVRLATVALHDGHAAMRLPVLLAGALRDRIVGGGLLVDAALDDTLRECERFALDPQTFVTTLLVVQVWGRRGEP
jgi:SAM-dependent methyltransferase